jgi:hypothetical protein
MGRGFDKIKLIPPDLGPLLSGTPHPRAILHYEGGGNVHLAWSCIIYEGGVMFTYPALWGSDVHHVIQRGQTLSKAMKHSKKVIWRVPYVIQYSNICPSKEEGSYAYYLRAGGTLHLWAYTYYLGMGMTLCRFISIRSR